VSYDQALAVLNDLFSVLSREVATDSGLFSRDVWNKTLAEVCRRAIVNVEKTGGDEAAVKEEIRIIEKKEALLRTIIDAVAPR